MNLEDIINGLNNIEMNPQGDHHFNSGMDLSEIINNLQENGQDEADLILTNQKLTQVRN